MAGHPSLPANLNTTHPNITQTPHPNHTHKLHTQPPSVQRGAEEKKEWSHTYGKLLHFLFSLFTSSIY